MASSTASRTPSSGADAVAPTKTTCAPSSRRHSSIKSSAPLRSLRRPSETIARSRSSFFATTSSIHSSLSPREQFAVEGVSTPPPGSPRPARRRTRPRRSTLRVASSRTSRLGRPRRGCARSGPGARGWGTRRSESTAPPSLRRCPCRCGSRRGSAPRPGRALHAELDERLVEREPVKVAMHVAQHAVDLHDHEQRLGRGGFVILAVRRRPRRDAGGFAPGSAPASRDPAGVERGVAERAGRRGFERLDGPVPRAIARHGASDATAVIFFADAREELTSSQKRSAGGRVDRAQCGAAGVPKLLSRCVGPRGKPRALVFTRAYVRRRRARATQCAHCASPGCRCRRHFFPAATAVQKKIIFPGAQAWTHIGATQASSPALFFG